MMSIPYEDSDLGAVVVGRMSPKDVHILIPGTWGNVTLYGKKDLDIIKVTEFKIGRLSCIISLASI